MKNKKMIAALFAAVAAATPGRAVVDEVLGGICIGYKYEVFVADMAYCDGVHALDAALCGASSFFSVFTGSYSPAARAQCLSEAYGASTSCEKNAAQYFYDSCMSDCSQYFE